MIEYLLMVQICTASSPECLWHRVQRFKTEESCVMGGLAVDPAVVRFKCVGIEQRPADIIFIPLPKPRPSSAPR